MVQWLGLRAFTAEGPGLTPSQGTKIPQDVWRSQKKKNVRTETKSWYKIKGIQKCAPDTNDRKSDFNKADVGQVCKWGQLDDPHIWSVTHQAL